MRLFCILFLVILFFQSCLAPHKIRTLKIKGIDLFTPSLSDTLTIKTLSVIDRFWDNSVNVFQKSPLPFLVKAPNTIGNPEDLYNEIPKGRYEYSYNFVLKSLKSLIDTGMYPIRLDKNFSFKNDSLFKQLIKDSSFKINFDTNHIKKLSLNLEDGLHVLATVIRYHDDFDRVKGEQTMLLFVYVEFFVIAHDEIKNYVCLLRKRSGNGGINAFKTDSKRHNWRVDNEDVRLIVKKLYELNTNKEGKK